MSRIAEDLLAVSDALANEAAGQIKTSIEAYRAGMVDDGELHEALIANLTHILGALSGSGGADLASAYAVGRTRAYQGVPLHDVLRAYRLGFAFVWSRLLDAARKDGSSAVAALMTAAAGVWELADDFPTAMTDAYRSALTERMLIADRRRSGLLSALFEGAGPYSPWEIAQLLEIPYRGRFLVLVVETGADADPTGPHLSERLEALGVSSAWRGQADHEVGLLSVGGRRPVEDVIEMISIHTIARIGISPLFERLEDAGRAFRLGQVAMESLPAGSSAIRQLEDEPVLDLLVRDREATRRFVNRVLGNVLHLPDDDRATLLATATAWLEAHGSAADAGRILYCHENTVRHRIHRLEEHVGGSFDDPRNLSDLLTALQALRTFPEFVEMEPE